MLLWLQAVFARASPSLVALAIVKGDSSGAEVIEGVGSGFIWDSYGHVVTNYHCVGSLVLDKSASKVWSSSCDIQGIIDPYPCDC